jgi:hypothetical protein
LLFLWLHCVSVVCFLCICSPSTYYSGCGGRRLLRRKCLVTGHFGLWRPSYFWRCEESELPWYLSVALHEPTDDMVCGWLFSCFILSLWWRVLWSSVTLRP